MAQSDVSDDELRCRAKIIVADYEGIYPAHGAFYIQAIRYAAGRANASFQRFEEAVVNKESYSEIVANVHEALGHAAALSRFFFPPSKQPLARARAAKLRKKFAIGNGSSLIDRDLRNALEHFDERLDKYLLGDVVGYIFPTPLVEDAALADDPQGHIFQLVDPKRHIFVLLGQKYDFGQMRQEVNRIAAFVEGIA